MFREFRILTAFALATIVVATLTACAMDQASVGAEKNIALMEESLPAANTFSGNYLAGRFAQRQDDWRAAQNYMNEVIVHDESNTLLMQKTFLLTLGAGNYPQAKILAEKVMEKTGGNDLAAIYLTVDALSRDDFAGALEMAAKVSDEGFGRYTKPLMTAWAEMGLGHVEKARAIIDANSDMDDPSYHIHKGLLAELAGDMNTAATEYKIAMGQGLSLHSAIMVGNFFERYGQPEITKMIYDSLVQIYPFNPFVSALAAADPHRALEPNILRAADGAGFALFDLSALLYEKKAYDSAQIYGSMVQLLMPQSPFAAMMMGDIAALHEKYSNAINAYNSISAASPLYWLSRMRVSEVYEASGRTAEAVTLLQELTTHPTTRLQAFVAIGDIYRRQEDFANALKAYDEALLGIDDITEEQWPIVYARGIALERLNNWTRAEKDLLAALKFQPDNPMILNFIGYSWADKGMNLDKALEYVRRAVTLRPDDGYIIDSYAWALYKSGRYDEAAEWMERAVEKVPGDPTLLDHMGDIYWQVGRKNEARFAWKRAADMSKDSAFRATLQVKIQKGLAPEKPVIAQKEAKL